MPSSAARRAAMPSSRTRPSRISAPSRARRRALPAFVLGEELADLADRDPRIVVLTADLASANRTKDFKRRHPDRFFDFGIAEKNMITTAAGMAVRRPYRLCRDLRRLQRHPRRGADP